MAAGFGRQIPLRGWEWVCPEGGAGRGDVLPYQRVLSWRGIRDDRELFEIEGAGASWLEGEASTAGLSDGVEYRIHADGFDFKNLCHEFAKAAFWEAAFLKPSEVFDGEVHDGDAGRWVGFDAEFSKRDPGSADFLEQVAKVLAVDFGEVGHGWDKFADRWSIGKHGDFEPRRAVGESGWEYNS